MKKCFSIILIVAMMSLTLPFAGSSYAADPVTQEITSEEMARSIASDAGGSYIEGAATPSVTGSQVALPVLDKATGTVVGHIVADQAALVTALNAAGLTEVASAVSAMGAGTSTGILAGTGLALGTTGTVAVVAGVIIVALVIANDDGSSTTVHH